MLQRGFEIQKQITKSIERIGPRRHTNYQNAEAMICTLK